MRSLSLRINKSNQEICYSHGNWIPSSTVYVHASTLLTSCGTPPKCAVQMLMLINLSLCKTNQYAQLQHIVIVIPAQCSVYGRLFYIDIFGFEQVRLSRRRTRWLGWCCCDRCGLVVIGREG